METLESKGTTMEEFEAKMDEIVEKAEQEKEAKLNAPPTPPPDPDKLAEGIIQKSEEPVLEKPELKPKPQEKDWKAEHDKMFAKLSDVIRGHKEVNDRLTQEIDTLRKEVAELREKKSPEPQTFSEKDRAQIAESFGVSEDDVAGMEKLMEQFATKATASLQSKLDKAYEEIKALKGGVEQSEKTARAKANALYKKALTDADADAISLMQSDDFYNWASTNKVSDLDDDTLWDKAVKYDSAENATQMLKIIGMYKKTLVPADEVALPDAQPPKGRGAPPKKPEKKIYSRSEAKAFMSEYAKLPFGEYANKAKTPEGEKKLDELYEDILAAEKEGRITSP